MTMMKILSRRRNLDHRPHNGVSTTAASPNLETSNIELTTYTSLRDLLPPPPQQKSSWYEIPITNPLVKHAAIAYLQPMLTPPDLRRGLLERLKDACGCSDDGCLWWIREAVLRVFNATYGNSDEKFD